MVSDLFGDVCCIFYALICCPSSISPFFKWVIYTGSLLSSVVTFSIILQVYIEFTDGEDKICLEGPTKEVKLVQEQIEIVVQDLVSIG